MVVTQTFIFIKAIFIKIWRICRRPKRFVFFFIVLLIHTIYTLSFPAPLFLFFVNTMAATSFLGSLSCSLLPFFLIQIALLLFSSSILFSHSSATSVLVCNRKSKNDHFCCHTELHVGSSIGPGTLQCSFKPWSYLSSWGRLRLEIMTWYI